MNLEQGRAFLECLGVKQSKMKSDAKWLRCSCPLARWTHQHHKDSNPSFALSLDSTQAPFYTCFTCFSGSAEDLLQTLELYTRETPELQHMYNFARAHEILDDAELMLPVLGEYTEGVTDDHKQFAPWPEVYLESFIRANQHLSSAEYLIAPKDHFNEFGQKCRAIPLEKVIEFDLRYDSSRGMVVFPYRDAYGRLAGMRGRSLTEKKHYDYTWQGVNNAGLVWYNEQCLDTLPGWVVVVEGQIDALRVSERWPKVVANMTAKPSTSKLEKLMHAQGTILIPDADAGGVNSVKRYIEYHQMHDQPLRVLHLPDLGQKLDPDDCDPDYLHSRILEIL